MESIAVVSSRQSDVSDDCACIVNGKVSKPGDAWCKDDPWCEQPLRPLEPACSLISVNGFPARAKLYDARHHGEQNL